MRSGAANTHSTPHKPGKGRSSEEKQTHTRNLVTWPKTYSLSASQQKLRSGPLSVSKPRGVGRKVGNVSQRSDPGKVSASDDLTLDLCNPCVRIQRWVSLSDSPFSSQCLGLFSISPDGITPRWLDTPTLTANVHQHMLDDDRFFFFCFLFSPLGLFSMGFWPGQWAFGSHRLTDITLYPQIHPRVSVTMRRSKGLAESTEVYSAENHFFRR